MFNSTAVAICLAALNITSFVLYDTPGDNPFVYIFHETSQEYQELRDRARPCVSQYENQDTTWFTSYKSGRHDFEVMSNASQLRFTEIEDQWLASHPSHEQAEQASVHETSHEYFNGTSIDYTTSQRAFVVVAYADKRFDQRIGICKDTQFSSTCYTIPGTTPKGMYLANRGSFEIDANIWLHHECDTRQVNGQGGEVLRSQAAVHAHNEVWYNKKQCSSYWLRDNNREDVPTGSGPRGSVQPAKYCAMGS